MVYDRVEKRMVQATDDEDRNIWTFDSAGANRAFELLGKHLNIFTEKVEHTGLVAFMTKEERQERIDELIRKRGTGTIDAAGTGASRV